LAAGFPDLCCCIVIVYLGLGRFGSMLFGGLHGSPFLDRACRAADRATPKHTRSACTPRGRQLGWASCAGVPVATTCSRSSRFSRASTNWSARRLWKCVSREYPILMGEPRSPRGCIAYKPPLSQPGRAAQKRTNSGKDAIVFLLTPYSSAPISPRTFWNVGGSVDWKLGRLPGLESNRVEATESPLSGDERCARARRASRRMSEAARMLPRGATRAMLWATSCAAPASN
jgi:hypothetical protein